MDLWHGLKNIFNKSCKLSDEQHLNAVQGIIGYYFHDLDLLHLALTHRSFYRKKNNRARSNERLEFLGDSVLGLVIADCLYRDYPGYREGHLTKIKAMLVNEITLSNVAKGIELNKHILMSPEENRLGGRERPSIISDAFESVIGAVYLDGGFDVAGDIIRRLIYLKKDVITTDDAQKNFKGDLLEKLQARGNGMPRYEVISERGPDHEKEFSIAVYTNGQKIGEGIGSTKKEAEQKAAAMAIDSLKD